MWCKQFITHIILVAAEGLWHLGSLFYQDTQCSYLHIYSGVIFHEIRHHAQAHVTSGAIIHCAFSLATRRTQTEVELGRRFCWPVLVMVALESHNVCCDHTWSSNQSVGGAILDLSSFFNQIPHQKEPEISVGIFSPT